MHGIGKPQCRDIGTQLVRLESQKTVLNVVWILTPGAERPRTCYPNRTIKQQNQNPSWHPGHAFPGHLLCPTPEKRKTIWMVSLCSNQVSVTPRKETDQIQPAEKILLSQVPRFNATDNSGQTQGLPLRAEGGCFTHPPIHHQSSLKLLSPRSLTIQYGLQYMWGHREHCLRSTGGETLGSGLVY